MSERESTQYEPRSDYAITLEKYAGIAGDIMEINTPVADGFMSVADIRRDIVIVKKQPQRTQEYEQLGNTRVGKQLRIPTWGKSEEPIFDLSSDEDAWYVAIDDQLLARKATEKAGKKKFDDLFTADFQRQLNKGIRKLLIKEKLLNGEYYDFAFISAYLNLFLGTTAAITHLSPVALVENYFLFNLFPSVFLYKVGPQVVNHSEEPGNNALRITNTHEPFIRSSVKQCLMPFIPIDRLVRGGFYLATHGNHMIKSP